MADCEWVILCDYAFQDAGRKTCMIGVFDRIYAAKVPAQHHQAALVFKATGDPSESIEFKVEITRPTGGTLGSIGGKIVMPPTGTVDVIANLQGMPLPDNGVYAFALFFNDELKKLVNVTVLEPPVPQKPKESGGAGGEAP